MSNYQKVDGSNPAPSQSVACSSHPLVCDCVSEWEALWGIVKVVENAILVQSISSFSVIFIYACSALASVAFHYCGNGWNYFISRGRGLICVKLMRNRKHSDELLEWTGVFAFHVPDAAMQKSTHLF